MYYLVSCNTKYILYDYSGLHVSLYLHVRNNIVTHDFYYTDQLGLGISMIMQYRSVASSDPDSDLT